MKNEEYKTIKELADELGVTKQTVQYHYKSFADKETVLSDKGAILLDRRLQALLSEKIGKKNKTIVCKVVVNGRLVKATQMDLF